MLKWIAARDFRCFDSVRAELHPETTVLVGRNAQGKTSLLEAMCVLMRLQSPRTSVRGEMIRHDAKTAMLEGQLGDLQLRCGFSATQRRLALDGAVCGRSVEYLGGSAPVVWMDHGDMNLLRGGAESRRRYLDFTASQTSADYLEALRSYDKAMRSRNHVLKRDAVVNWRQADAYARVMEQHAEVIRGHREALVEVLLPEARNAMATLSSGSEQVDIAFVRGWEGPSLFDALADLRIQEERTRSTAVGAHRDDLRLTLNGRDATSYASEGQQRSISVALKLSQTRVLGSRRGIPPLLLLDDVFGELDANRRKLLLENLPPGTQRVITTTGGEWIRAMGEHSVYEVEGALLRPVSL